MTLYTISAGGFSAVADAFALDGGEGLWFLSMVGPQNALKAIWAGLLKQPPEAAWLAEGVDGAYSGEYRRCAVPYETLGTWTTRIARLPASGSYHAVVCTRLAEFGFDREQFLLLARTAEEAPLLHYRFLDRRVPLPLHPGWAAWLWERALGSGEVEPLQSQGILAYRCRPVVQDLKHALSAAVAAGRLGVPSDRAEDAGGQSRPEPSTIMQTPERGGERWRS